MTLVAPRPRTADRPRSETRRDGAVDLARAASLIVVVLLHAMMVGVSMVDGMPVFENAMQSWEGFPAATWVVQVMPLFFVLGGYSSYMDWTRRHASGQGYTRYVRTRVGRLIAPAIGALAATAILLAGLTIAGVPAGVVSEAGFRLSQPLWFLGVYLLCTILVPVAVAAHVRRPFLAIGVLAAGVVTVDVLRVATGVDGLGFVNLLFVWVLLQQVGFFMAEGFLGRLSPRPALVFGAMSFILLGVTVALGMYTGDLFEALNPPTGALVILGVAQASIFQAMRAPLRALSENAAVAAAARWIGARSMTIYAWHMLVLIGLAGVSLVIPAALPDVLSADWWSTRPAWLIVSLVAVGVVAAVAGRAEATKSASTSTSRGGIATTVVIAATAAAGIVVILVGGGSLAAWVVGLTLGRVALGAVSPEASPSQRRTLRR
ncbi:acyltransferase [Microbacterium koreense]|uniref:Acyltransferase n=1 Tax=Microbacterium koreense TaxID=323761 RepID=A0ABW2ZNH2_9MICO